MPEVSRELRRWSDPPDFEALRAAWVARRDFAEACVDARPVSPAFEALRAERWPELLAIVEAWTQRCPVDMEAHSLAAMALEQLGRAEEAQDHEMWARGLFEAALATGDGRTPETAYLVIAEFEEYSLLRLFRYPPKRQTRVGDADAFTVQAEGEERVVYFEQPRRARLARSRDVQRSRSERATASD